MKSILCRSNGDYSRNPGLIILLILFTIVSYSVAAECGDKICEADEIETCCIDCGCTGPSQCDETSNKCIPGICHYIDVSLKIAEDSLDLSREYVDLYVYIRILPVYLSDTPYIFDFGFESEYFLLDSGFSQISSNTTYYIYKARLRPVRISNEMIGKVKVISRKEDCQTIYSEKMFSIKPPTSMVSITIKKNYIYGIFSFVVITALVYLLRTKRSRIRKIDLQGIKAGNIYLITDISLARELFVYFSKKASKSLFVVRIHPSKLRSQYNIDEDIDDIWLTWKGITLSELAQELNKFLKEKNALVLLDGIEFLITRHGFNSVLKLIQYISEIVATNKSLVFIAIEPSTLDKKEFMLISREARVVNSSSVG